MLENVRKHEIPRHRKIKINARCSISSPSLPALPPSPPGPWFLVNISLAGNNCLPPKSIWDSVHPLISRKTSKQHKALPPPPQSNRTVSARQYLRHPELKWIQMCCSALMRTVSLHSPPPEAHFTPLCQPPIRTFLINTDTCQGSISPAGMLIKGKSICRDKLGLWYTSVHTCRH